MGRLATALLVIATLAATATGEKRMVYIGGDSLLEFEAPEGPFSVWKLEQEAIGNCNPFPNLPMVTGRMSGISKVTFLGGRELLHVDSESGTFEMMGCQAQLPDKSVGTKAALDCKTSLNGTLDIFEGGLKNEVAAAHDKILEYNPSTGDFYVYQINMQPGEYGSLPTDCSVTDSCGIQAPVVASGSLRAICGHAPKVAANGADNSKEDAYAVTGLGESNFVVQCKGTSRFSVLELVPVAYQEFSIGVKINGTFAGEGFDLLTLPADRFMRFNSESLEWDIHECNDKRCVKVSGGSFFDELECSHTTVNSCLNDTKCGYCVDAARCVAATPAGVCWGECQKFVTNFVGDSPVEEQLPAETSQVVYLGDKMVLRYVASSGKYSIHEIVENHPEFDGKCPYLGQDPVYSGKVGYKDFKISYYGERMVMFRNPKSGFFAIWKCQPMSRMSPMQAAPCDFATEGRLPFAVAPNTVLSFGDYTMGINQVTGFIQTYKVRDTEGDVLEESFFEDVPTFNQTVDVLKHRRVAHLGYSYLIDWNNFGEYRVWSWDANRGVISGPTATGQFANMVYDVSWLGEDRMLLSNPDDGKYLALRFEKDMLAHGSPLGFTTIGRGSFAQQVCTDLDTCDACAKDVRCGWCESTGTCMPGNERRSCSSGRSFKGCLIWTKGYCSKDACSNQLSRQDCLRFDTCGWCAKAFKCIPQVNGKAEHGNCPGNLYWRGMDQLTKARRAARVKTDL